MSDLMIGVLIAAATAVFVIIWVALIAAYDRWRGRYQARRRHVLHTAPADEKLAGTDVRTRYGGRNLTRQALADEYARLTDECGPRAEVIPWTPAPSMLPLRTEPPLEDLPLVGIPIPPGAPDLSPRTAPADNGPVPGTCACGRHAGHLEHKLLTMPVEDIGGAFDTATFPKVIA